MPFNKSLPDHERRYAPRRRIKIPFRFEIRNSELAPDWENLMQRTETDNVSKAGLFFQTHLQLKIGARLDMTIAMPGENGSQWACCGHVARVRQMPNGDRGIGLQFDWCSVLPLFESDVTVHLGDTRI
jgi:PilZ domain